jgi:hypothetical protein
MSLYTLKHNTYETFPNLKEDSQESELPPGQIRHIGNQLSDYFGSFMLFGLSLHGQPILIMSGSSGMEHLALKKFAEDVVLGESGVSIVSLEEDEEEDEY